MSLALFVVFGWMCCPMLERMALKFFVAARFVMRCVAVLPLSSTKSHVDFSSSFNVLHIRDEEKLPCRMMKPIRNFPDKFGNNSH